MPGLKSTPCHRCGIAAQTIDFFDRSKRICWRCADEVIETIQKRERAKRMAMPDEPVHPLLEIDFISMMQGINASGKSFSERYELAMNAVAILQNVI